MKPYSSQRAKPADHLRILAIVVVLLSAILAVARTLTWLEPGVSKTTPKPQVGRTEAELRQVLSEMLVGQNLRLEADLCRYWSRTLYTLQCQMPLSLEQPMARALGVGGWAASDKFRRYGRYVKGQIAASLWCRPPDAPDSCFFTLTLIPRSIATGDA